MDHRTLPLRVLDIKSGCMKYSG